MEIEQQEPASSKTSRPWWQRVRRWFFLYAVVPYLAVVVIFAIFQRQLMYRPTVAESLSIADLGLNPTFGVDVELQTADGNTVRGWLINATHRQSEQLNKTPLVVYFPGNSLNRHERINDLREVASQGLDVLIFDYRGFGDSTGSPSEAAISADTLMIWNYVKQELGRDESEIVIFGKSIGGAVALSMWSDQRSKGPQPAAVILNATFLSMPETVAGHYPLFPFRFLLLDRWPSVERITRVNPPVIVFHGSCFARTKVGANSAERKIRRNSWGHSQRHSNDLTARGIGRHPGRPGTCKHKRRFRIAGNAKAPQGWFPTIPTARSITLVCVGPVMSRPSSC